MLKLIRSSLPIVIGLVLASTVAIGCGRKTTSNQSRPAKVTDPLARSFQISQLVPQATPAESKMNTAGVYFAQNSNGSLALNAVSNPSWAQYEAEIAVETALKSALQSSMLDVMGRNKVGEALGLLQTDLDYLESSL